MPPKRETRWAVVNAYIEAARYHEKEIVRMEKEIAEARKWSAEHNDGYRYAGGTLFEEEYPIMIGTHRQAANHFRDQAKLRVKANSPVMFSESREEALALLKTPLPAGAAETEFNNRK